MNNGFWGKLKKPFFVLAPMLDITDSPFRQIVAECGRPDVFYTWFISVDGLCSKGKENILKNPNVHITEKERPIVAQIFGKDPQKFYQSAKILCEIGFDGIDINMGCPDRDILKQGAGAELIKNPKLSREIIKATKDGAGKIPVSVKTRIGYLKNEVESWIPEIIKEKPAAICVHGRTCKQNYGGISDWGIIKKAAEISRGSGVLIIGNGDVKNLKEGKIRAQESGVDGIMIGREILANPWLFKKDRKIISRKDKLKILVKHADLFEKYYKDKKNFNNFKKYFRSYVSGFENSKSLRMKLMEARNSSEIQRIIESY
jgi:nifR3 family TIM-barrel protein